MERQNQWMSWNQLIQEMVAHYQGQVVKQLYVLVLGLDVIGNPFGLVVGLTKGVEDLFYEPFQVRLTFSSIEDSQAHKTKLYFHFDKNSYKT